MTKTDVWMPLFIGDYMTATSRLTTEQHGAYLLLIMDYWKNGPLPDNDQILAQITRMRPDAWSNARGVLAGFFKVANGQWRHSRIEKEIAEAVERKGKAKDKASKAAQARWSASGNARSNARSNASDMLEQCPSPSPSPSPLPLPSESPQSAGADAPAGKPASHPRKRKIPDDFQPTDDHRDQAGKLNVSLHDELQKFRDHFTANGKPMADWNAAFRNWIRRSSEFKREKSGGHQQETPQQRAERMARERGYIQ